MCNEGLLIRIRYGVYGPGPNAERFVADLKPNEHNDLRAAS